MAEATLDMGGSIMNGLPAISMGRTTLQAGWRRAGVRYGVVGVLPWSTSSERVASRGLEAFTAFTGFAWDRAARQLRVLSPGGHSPAGGSDRGDLDDSGAGTERRSARVGAKLLATRGTRQAMAFTAQDGPGRRPMLEAALASARTWRGTLAAGAATIRMPRQG